MSDDGSLPVKSGWRRAILHVDMDAFFVNVHLLDHPEDRQQPLVVGGRPDQRGVVASASYEARRLGIRSAMPTRTAVVLCRQLKIVPASWPRIRECSRQVMALLSDFGTIEQMSVDEAYIDLSDQADPVKVARQIQARIKAEAQLPCSVGLATSKLVAKIASDFDKPQGCTIVLPGEEAPFLAPLPTRAILGIGPRTAERLASVGVETCGQLAVASTSTLAGAVGRRLAGELQARAHGEDNRPVQPVRGTAKSISQEWTFNTDVDDAAILRKQLRKMCAGVARSLEKHQLAAHTVYVKFRWSDFTTFTRQKSVAVALSSEADIFRLAEAIWREHWQKGQPVRLLGVGVSKIEEASVRQLGFDF